MSLFRKNSRGTGGYFLTHKEGISSAGNTTDEVLGEIVAENGLYEEIDAEDRLVIKQGGDFIENTSSEFSAPLVGKLASYQLQQGPDLFGDRRTDFIATGNNEGMAFSTANLASLYLADGITVAAPTKTGIIGIQGDPTSAVWSPVLGASILDLDTFQLQNQALIPTGPYMNSINGALGIVSALQVLAMNPIIISSDNLSGAGDWEYKQTLAHNNGAIGKMIWEFTETNLQSQIFVAGDFARYSMDVNQFLIKNHTSTDVFFVSTQGNIGISNHDGTVTVGAQLNRFPIYDIDGGLIGYVPIYAAA